MIEAIQEHYRTALAVSVLLCALIATGTFCTRTQPHTDEVWSYMLSNKYDSPFLYAHGPGIGEESGNIYDFVLEESQSYQDYFHHWHDGEYYRDALTVQPGEQFAYDRVSYNQSLDTHPPLYYFLLHTICSFFPNQFSWLFAFSINIVFYIGSMVLIFRIGNALGMEESRSLLASIFWGLSSAGIYEVCFLRMYMMLTFIMLYVTYLYVRMSHSFSIKCVAITALMCTLGFLTHYYAYIYIFFLTLFYIIQLFCRREYAHGILHGLTILLSVGVAVTLFPAVLKHVFSGLFGVFVAHGTHPGFVFAFFDMLHLVLQSYTGINISLRYILPGIFIAGYLLHLIALLRRAWKRNSVSNSCFERILRIGRFIFRADKHYLHILFQKMGDSSWKLILFSVLASSVVIVNISPNMRLLTVRYLFTTLPCFSLLLLHYTEMLLFSRRGKTDNRSPHQMAVMCTICAASVLSSHMFSGDSNFLHNIDDTTGDYRQYFKNSNIVLVDGTHYTQAFTPWLMSSLEVFPTDKIDPNVYAILSNYNDKDTPLYFVISSHYYEKSAMDQYLSTAVPGRYSYIGAYHCSTDNPDYYLFYKIKRQ